MAVTAPGSPYVETSDLVANYPGVSESLAERVDLVGVLPFANSTARGTALPSPTDGQYSYLQDTNATEYYNGSAWVAAGVAPGLVHINTTTFAAQSAVSINDCFNSNYSHYRIFINASATVDGALEIRMRAGGTDNSATNYRHVRVETRIGATSGVGSNLDTKWITAYWGLADENAIVIDILNPFLTQKTLFNGIGNGTNASYSYISTVSGMLTVTTSYTGFSFIRTSGTMTGTVTIYGYKAG